MLVDNLKHVNIMEEAGFDENQSKAIVRVWSDIVELELVTKKDLKIAFLESEARMSQRFNGLESRISGVEQEFEKIGNKLFAKLAGMQFVMAGFIVGILKLT